MNLVVVCQKCHRNIHQGRLIVRGRAPGSLTWRSKHGTEILRFQGYRYPRHLTEWFRRPLEESDPQATSRSESG